MNKGRPFSNDTELHWLSWIEQINENMLWTDWYYNLASWSTHEIELAPLLVHLSEV